MKKPLIVIAGPTACGKSAVSVELAKNNKRRNYFCRFHASLQRYGYRYCKNH